MTRIQIRFKETYKGYVKGDVALFDMGVGTELIKKGVAVKVKEVEVSDRSIHGPDLTRGDKKLDAKRTEGKKIETKAVKPPKKKGKR